MRLKTLLVPVLSIPISLFLVSCLWVGRSVGRSVCYVLLYVDALGSPRIASHRIASVPQRGGLSVSGYLSA